MVLVSLTGVRVQVSRRAKAKMPIDTSLNGQSKSELMIGLTATLGFFATLSVLLRIYTRAIQLHNAGLDDYTIVITMVHHSTPRWLPYQAPPHPASVLARLTRCLGPCEWFQRLNLLRFADLPAVLVDLVGCLY